MKRDSNYTHPDLIDNDPPRPPLGAISLAASLTLAEAGAIADRPQDYPLHRLELAHERLARTLGGRRSSDSAQLRLRARLARLASAIVERRSVGGG